MRILLVSIPVTVAVLLALMPRIFRDQEIGIHELHVRQQIETFKSQGALELPTTLENSQFMIPQKSFYYGGGFTYGQLRQAIADQVREGIDHLERSASFLPYAKYIAEAFVKDTRFHGRVTVNQTPIPGYLNLYFVKRVGAVNASGRDAPQCSYIGFDDAIFCDSDSIAASFSQIDKVPANESVVIAVLDPDQKLHMNMLANLDVLRRLLKENLLIWVIGHEVGHAINDHEWILNHDAPLHFDGNYNNREERADSFAAGVVLRNNQLGANFTTLLLEFITQSFEQEYRLQYSRAPDFMRGAKNIPLKIRTSRYSRPMLLRSVQVMEQVLKLDSTALDKADYAVINGRLAYIHSIQFPDRVAQIRSYIVVQGEPNRSGLAVPVALGAFLVVIGSLIWLIRTERIHS